MERSQEEHREGLRRYLAAHGIQADIHETGIGLNSDYMDVTITPDLTTKGDLALWIRVRDVWMMGSL